MKTDPSMSSSAPRPRNIVISGTNFWNPGDDFVRDGVIRVLRELFPATPLNFLFYNFNADFFPQDKFAGIGNYVAKGDLDQYRDAIDDVVIAGLSAGDEIKDLYRWVIANGLAEKILLIGAGYENTYVTDHVLTEPEATIFRKARIVIGRTGKTPAFVRQTGVPYVHLNCPAMLSVPEVKKIPAGHTIQRIGFSIQLPHEAGIANQSCDRKQYELAVAVLRDLSRQYQVEVVAHHKTEYFHFLKLLRGENIPVLFSSFYQDLHALYQRYDLVITTRLHSSLFANGHGIPGIIINDTDRHTQTLAGFLHSVWVNSRESFDREFKRICACNLAEIAREADAFKSELLGKYVAALSQVIPADARAAADNYAFDSEKKEQALVRSLVKPGMVVFDVGANIGKYTKLFSLLVGESGKVFAFEPDPRSAQRVRQLAAADALANVSVINQAVAESPGTVTLNQFPEEYCSWNSLGRPQMEDPRNPSQLVPIVSSVEVEAVTLDAFCREQGITQIDYLKLDVEGAEFRALQGAKSLLKKQAIRFLQFEVSRKMLEGLNTSAKPVFDLLAACGYECHVIAPDGRLGGLVSDSSEFYENYLAMPARTEASVAEFFPALLTALQHPDNKRRVLSIISKLEKDHWLERNLVRYQDTAKWFDTATLLNWFARTLKPRNYLEIGVRRGRSMAQVSVESPDTQCFGFDLWIPDYGSIPKQGIHTTNPGPEFVLAELKKLGVARPPALIRGNSLETVPAFFDDPANPQTFDLILVDGDHTRDGARADLEVAFAHLAPGGALVFDDICNPAHLDLRELWDEFARLHPDFLFLNDNFAAGTGVAFRPPFHRLAQALAGQSPVAASDAASAPATARPQEPLPIHFFTIVLNGQPFIQHHINVLRRLPFQWHWHIVEGVAELNHDTSWSKATGGCIPAELHRNGLSVDGTTEYLDALKKEFPQNITIYRPPAGKFWDGKREMVNAPLANIRGECLLWQIDADELWTEAQITKTRQLFLAQPDKTAALFFCHYFVGKDLVVTSRDTYGNNSSYEWLRVWRHQPGDSWVSHEPPRLDRKGRDVASLNPFSHAETEAAGLVFQHFAYATEAQARFKESYYGYAGAVEQWRKLQNASNFPQRLGNHFAWVKDEAIVNTARAAGIVRVAPDQWFNETTGAPASNGLNTPRRILFVRTDSIGDSVLASAMLEPIRKQFPNAQLAVLCQQHVADLYTACPFVNSIICFDRKKVEADAAERAQIVAEIAAFKPDVILNSVRSRDRLSDELTLAFPDARHIAIAGDLNNISETDRNSADAGYEEIIASPDTHQTELQRHAGFLRGLGIRTSDLQPTVWTSHEDELLAEEFFKSQNLDPKTTIAIFPGAQHAIRHYRHYAGALKSLDGYRFLIFGDASESSMAEEIELQLPGRTVNLCGRATLRETAALLRRCRLYVGAESAGAHIACAVGVPNVVLLGGGHFGRFMPYSPLTSAVSLPLDCFDCNWRCSHSRAHCIKDVSPEVITEAVRQTLEHTAEKPRLFLQAAADWRGTGVPPVRFNSNAQAARAANLPAWRRPDPLLCVDAEIIEVNCSRPAANETSASNSRPPAKVAAASSTADELTPAAKEQIALAEAAIARDDAAGAIAALEAAHNACPNNADILIALGNVQFHLENFPASFAALQPAAQLRPNDPLVQVLLATAAVKCDRMPDFENAVNRALELDRNFAPAHRLLADLNLQAGRFADAAREYGILFKQNPNDIPVMLALGKCLAELRQFEAAEECFAHVLKLDRHNQLASQNLDHLRSRPRHPNAYQAAAATTDPRLETIGCPFCQSRNARQVRKSADIVRCNDCNTVYLRTRAKKEVMEKLYQTYADDGSHMALPKTFDDADHSGLKRDYFLKEILQFTKAEGKLLDVGCGWGAFLLNGRQHGFDVSGLEITRKAAGYGNQSLQIPIKTTQFLDTEYAPDSHSVITMLHVFEHLPYPKQALDKVFQTLKPGGMFCGIVPNFDSFCSHALGERWYWLDPNYHYVHYTPATLRKHLEAAGFIVERIYTNTGDYGQDPIKKLLAAQDAAAAEPSIFSERLKQIETEGRGEEIRFFARKPAQVKAEEPLEIIGGERLANPLVTVAVSTFNSEAFLRPCLENLSRQTLFPQVEVIIVDSGSEQNERAIALEFISKHPNIRYVRTPRETLYGAWNRALNLARGRYFANVNTDDSLRNDALEALIAALDKHADCALAYGDTAWTTKANDTFPSANIVRTVKYPDYAPVHTLFYCITGCLQFWRTDSIRKLGGFDASLRCAGDYEATLKMMAARMNAVHVPEVLNLFYQNTAGLTQASNRADIEHEQVMNRYRGALDIANIFEVEAGKPSSAATALAMLGVHAAHSFVPWEDKPVEHMNFAFECLHRAVDLDPENTAAGTNLVALSHKLKRLEPDQADLIRRWPKMREWIAVFKMGDAAHTPHVKHAVSGPVYRPAEWKNRPTAEQLAREPKALRPWISRIEGRHVYLSEDLFPRPSGPVYRPDELQAAGKRLAALLAELPPFYAHLGGAGDALLLMASFYDKRPDAVVFSHPNSVPAARALFEAFPKLSKIYFLPQHTEAFFHIVLRFALYELRNCLGAGTTPKFGYDEEWKASLDIEKKYGINKSPRWAAAMRNNDGSRRVALAPKGSLTGMIGSKRNIIPTELWPQVIAHIIERGLEPVIFGVPSEAKEYPALAGCADARGETFAGQIRLIGECAGLVGADSWAKTFTALAQIPTIVFEPLKGPDLQAWKDPSDWVFIEPWPAIKMVRSFEQFRREFDSRIAKVLPACTRQNSKPVIAWEGSYLDYGSLSNINRELTSRLGGSVELTRVSTALAPQQGAADLQSAESRAQRSHNGQNLSQSRSDAPQAIRDLAKSLATHAPQNPAITVRHQWPPNWSKPASGKLVVIQPWEYGALPKAWVEAAGNVDEFWVPSPIVRAMYVNSGIAPEKVRVVPNGVDTKKFHPDARALALPTKKKFKFLFVGGTIFRKGIDVLLEAYQETFTAKDDVCLIVKDFGGDSFYRGQTAQEAIRTIQQKPGAPEIVYLTDELSPDAMPSLYAACDCLVLPYRGEGFGMPVLEAMSCGLPVIVTGGGATDYFATAETGWILPSQGARIGDRVGNIQLVKNGWLRQPSKAHLAFAMERAFKNPAECKRRGLAGRAIALRRFDWSDVAAAVAHRLRELAEDASPETEVVEVSPGQTSTSSSKAVPPPHARAHEQAPACARLGDLSKARQLSGGKKFADAWQATLSAIKARPFHPEGFLLLAEIALATGDANTARVCARRARDFAPDWTSAKQVLKRAEGGKRKVENEALAALMAKDAARIAEHGKRLSVCLIVKNEEQFLAQCLRSIRNLAHQIVVVDTGSTDRTVEIAKEHGAEVHSFAWCDDFSAARNAALEHATGDWILMLDADEELPADQHDHLLADLKRAGVIGHRLPLVNRGQEAEGRSFVPRLFRNAPGVFFRGRIHEQVFPSLVGIGKFWGLGTALGTAQITHHGYSKELVKDRNKIERNLALLRKAIEENPSDSNLVMNLGLELVRSGELQSGIEQYREAFRLMSAQLERNAPAMREPGRANQNLCASAEIVPELREVLLSQFTSHLYKVREHEEVVRVLTSPLAKHGGLTATLHFALGLSCFELKNYREAAEQMRLCLSKRNKPALSPINRDIHTAAPHHCMALSLAKLDDNAGAEKAFQAALTATGRTEEARLDYAKFLAQQNRQVDALHKLHDAVSQNSANAAAWRLGGEIALSHPEFLEFACDWTGEAANHLAGDIAIVAQRAEALLLSGDTAAARELWARICGTEIAGGPQPGARAMAALILCELVEGLPLTVPKSANEPGVTREFIAWYQKLIATGAHKLVGCVNDRTEALSHALPRAAGILEKALVEAHQHEAVPALN